MSVTLKNKFEELKEKIIITLIIIMFLYHAIGVHIICNDAFFYLLPGIKEIFETKKIPLYADGNEKSTINYELPFYLLVASIYFLVGKITWLISIVNPILLLLLLYVTYKINKKSALILLTIPLVFTITWEYEPEILETLFFAIGIYFWLRGDNNKNAFLSGLFLGLSVFSKFIAGLNVAILAIIVFFQKHNKEYKILFLIGILIFSPIMLIRNWVLLGNPVYPWFSRYFGGKNILPSMYNNPFYTYGKESQISSISGILIVNITTTGFLIPLFVFLLIKNRKKLDSVDRALLIIIFVSLIIWFLFIKTHLLRHVFLIVYTICLFIGRKIKNLRLIFLLILLIPTFFFLIKGKTALHLLDFTKVYTAPFRNDSELYSLCFSKGKLDGIDWLRHYGKNISILSYDKLPLAYFNGLDMQSYKAVFIFDDDVLSKLKANNINYIWVSEEYMEEYKMTKLPKIENYLKLVYLSTDVKIYYVS